MLHTLIYILFTIVFSYCSFSALYLFLFTMAGRLNRKNIYSEPPDRFRRIAILVPAYKEDAIIVSTASSLQDLDYPREFYDVYIIADSFSPYSLEQLKTYPVHVIQVVFDKSTKTKSLNAAFETIDPTYDIALICDADNILSSDFLKKINLAFSKGAKAVQGRRVAKNLDTSFAILDACSEGINNNIFRKGANGLGLSSSVIGSGMAFEFIFIKDILRKIKAVSGFDKIMQLKVVEQDIKIQYLENALIYDEKVDSSSAFGKQRKRWVSSQFIYLREFFGTACKQLFQGNFSYFNLAIVNNIILPRAFLLVLFPLLFICSFFISHSFVLASSLLWALSLLTLLLALPRELINKDLRKAVLQLPNAIGLMFGTLFHVNRANKTFIHTIHTKTEINNPLFNKHAD